jgi:hypothetical protein
MFGWGISADVFRNWELATVAGGVCLERTLSGLRFLIGKDNRSNSLPKARRQATI